MLAGADIEFVPVPGASDVGMIPGKGQPQAGLVLCDQLLHPGNDLALADGPSHVWADVLEGGELAVVAEHPDLDAIDLDNLSARVWKSAGRANRDVLHVPVSLAFIWGGGTTLQDRIG